MLQSIMVSAMKDCEPDLRVPTSNNQKGASVEQKWAPSLRVPGGGAQPQAARTSPIAPLFCGSLSQPAGHYGGFWFTHLQGTAGG